MTLLFLLLLDLLLLGFEDEGRRCWEDLPFLEEERECLMEILKKNVFGVPSRYIGKRSKGIYK